MSSDAPSERREPVKRRKPGTGTADSFFSAKSPGKSSRRADKIGANPVGIQLPRILGHLGNVGLVILHEINIPPLEEMKEL